MLWLLLLPLFAGISASFFVERCLAPRPVFILKRALAAQQLHFGSWLALFALLLLLVQRPWFAVVLLLAFQALLVLVNHAKYDSLREPFIFQDFEYFTDAIKHPRLYLPFFGIARTVIATLGFVAALIIGLTLESPLIVAIGLMPAVLVWLVLMGLAGLLIRLGLKNCPAITLKPAQDLLQLGQSAFFWAYWQAEQQTLIDGTPSLFTDITSIIPANGEGVDIVVVQSESFFDPRPLSSSITPEVLEHFDQIKTEASHSGRLHVPAWGANTVRTECGFLTGLTPKQLGIHQFNPYRLMAKQDVPNLVGALRNAGYHTIAIHPYPASFYLRDHVFPRMGFDEFIDIQGFSEQAKEGQYTGDQAVAQKIVDLLATRVSTDDKQQPLFIFVITMENHGPLHLEKAEQSDIENYYRHPPVSGCEDLTVYLRHLKNADFMIKTLKTCLQKNTESGRAGLLCWFGDHVPIMTQVYQQLGEPDGMTDYFIWQSGAVQQEKKANQHIAIHELTGLVLAELSGMTRKI
ncbi:MAG: LTA synthase family protein [Methylovulum sp.]|jgi:hypothetical protein|nr:LTA synthase family protein [Methylovulum sp.]